MIGDGFAVVARRQLIFVGGESDHHHVIVFAESLVSVIDLMSSGQYGAYVAY